MVRNSNQNWSNGSTVRVGFLTLVVICAVRTPGDYAPDAYLLRNRNGTKLYRFVPHNGLEAISLAEATAMQDEADRQGTTERAALDRLAKRVAQEAIERAQLMAKARDHFEAAFEFDSAQDAAERWTEFCAGIA